MKSKKILIEGDEAAKRYSREWLETTTWEKQYLANLSDQIRFVCPNCNTDQWAPYFDYIEDDIECKECDAFLNQTTVILL